MKILLFNPSWGARVHRQRFNRRWPPLDLLNLAAQLRNNGMDVSFRDARAAPLSPQSMSRHFHGVDKVIVTTSPLDRWQCPNTDIEPLLNWTKMVPQGKLILTGAHGTLCPEDLLNQTGAQYLVRGEPEAAVLSLCASLKDGANALGHVPSLSYPEGGEVRHTPSGPPVDLAALPLPAYDLTDPLHYEYELLGSPMAVLETSRGCPHRCTYCFKAMYGPSFRFKPLHQIGRELEHIVRLGYRFVYFMDLEFSMDRNRTIALCRVIKEFGIRWCCQTRVDAVDRDLLEEMAAAGCRLVHYGIESGNPQILENVRKNIRLPQVDVAIQWTRSAGMATAGFFLLGFPGEGPSSWSRTEKLARRLNVTYASFHQLTAYPQTDIGPVPLGSIPWYPNEVGQTLLKRRLHRAYLRYYLRPAYWKEYLLRGTHRFSGVRLFFQFLKDACGH